MFRFSKVSHLAPRLGSLPTPAIGSHPVPPLGSLLTLSIESTRALLPWWNLRAQALGQVFLGVGARPNGVKAPVVRRATRVRSRLGLARIMHSL